MTIATFPRSTTASDANVYPTLPLSASYTTVLSQDVLNTDTIPVDSNSAAPAAPFTNPAGGGQANNPAVEALVVTSDGKLGHVTRDLNTDAGWRLVTFDGVAASEVVAGTAYATGTQPGVYGLYQSGNTLSSMQLMADGTFGPATVVSSDTVNSHWRAAYSQAGQLLAYAQTNSGDLVVAFQPGVNVPFETQTYSMPAPLSDGNFFLCMGSGEQSWTMLAAVDSQDGSGGQCLWMYQGVTGDGSTAPTMSEAAPNYSGNIQRVVFGYWSPMQEQPMFLFVDASGVLQAYADGGFQIQPVPSPNPNSPITDASAHLYIDPNTGIDSIHVYTIDGNQNLAVLHQDRGTPWTDDGAPNWATYLPLDTQIAGVAIDGVATDVPTLFALTSDTFSLRLHAQDPLTCMWRTGNVLQSSPQAFEVVRHRLEVNLLDAAARPVPNYPVNLAIAKGYSGADIWVAGRTYPISSSLSADLTTDSTGKLTLAVLTHAGLAAPNLVLSADGLQVPVSLIPALGIHTYLSGDGTLNPTNPTNPANGSGPLDQFDADGSTLTNATVGGQLLAPATASNSDLAGVAAKAIQQTAMVGLDQTPPDVSGFQLNLADPHNPSFKLLHSSDEVAACVASMYPRTNGHVSAPGDVGDFFSDLWQSISNGLANIFECVVDCVNKVISITVQIEQSVTQGISLAMQGLEQAAQFISGVFQSIAAAVEDVLNWLKAVFDFGAIWRTKMAFQQRLEQAPAYINSLIQLGNQAGDKWFSKQLSIVNDNFNKAIAAYSGTTYVGLDPNFPALGSPPDNTTPLVGSASVADFTNNPHHNWLQDKAAAYAGSSTFGLQPYTDLEAPWQNFTSAINGSSQDFVSGLQDLADSISSTFQEPTQFGSGDIGAFLKAISHLIQGLLELCDAGLDALMGLASKATEALDALLKTSIDIDVLQTLWTWMATEAGYPDDDDLTISSLVSLLAAFPTTVIYKLIVGTDKEPFPNSGDGQMAATRSGSPMPPGCVLASAILQTVTAVPAICADLLGANSPTWLSLGLLADSIVIWALANGYPELDTITWVGIAIVAANLLWIAPTVYFVMQSVANALLQQIKSNSGDIMSIVSTIHGAGSLILHAILDILAPPDATQIVAGLLLPVPGIFSFANLSTFRNNSDIAPFAIGTKVIMDLVGYVGGGLALVIDATENINNG